DYRSEVALAGTFVRENFEFKLFGRADGIYDSEPRIEEIKSTFSLARLARELDEQEEHPYLLQLKTYCHLYWLQTDRVPRATLRLISSRTGEEKTKEIEYDPGDYEAWLAAKLDALVEEQHRIRQRVQRRKRLAKRLTF